MAYYAAVSYFDEHVGQVLEALRASGQENRTAVMLMGDHVRNRRASCSGSGGTRASDRVPCVVSAPRASATTPAHRAPASFLAENAGARVRACHC